jgi:hypothetical protein
MCGAVGFMGMFSQPMNAFLPALARKFGGIFGGWVQDKEGIERVCAAEFARFHKLGWRVKGAGSLEFWVWQRLRLPPGGSPKEIRAKIQKLEN